MFQNSDLFWFGCVLCVGLISTAIVVTNSGTDTEETTSLPYDKLLRDRMSALGISSWVALRDLSGLTPRAVLQVRKGKLGRLRFEELQRLTQALEWTQGELLEVFGISVSPPARKPSPEWEQLQQECQRLRQQLGQQKQQAQDFRETTFGELQTLLINYPTAYKMAQAQPDLLAKNFSTLFFPLENLMQQWGCEPIGSAWEQVSFNPQLHQPDTEEIEIGESVYIHFVGCRQGEEILCPAKVSRTLPVGAERRQNWFLTFILRRFGSSNGGHRQGVIENKNALGRLSTWMKQFWNWTSFSSFVWLCERWPSLLH